MYGGLSRVDTDAVLAGATTMVSELYLTTAARRGGEPGTSLRLDLLGSNHTLVEKHGRGEEQGVRFQHVVIRR